MINVEQAVRSKYPAVSQWPTFASVPFFSLLQRLFFQERINRFLSEHRDLQGVEFIDAVLDELGVDYAASAKSRANLPQTGRVVMIANHPMGGLDALTLIKLVSEVRSDIRIVANDMLMQFEPLRPLLLPVDNLKGRPSKLALLAIHEALAHEEVVILFPAGEVSRIRPTGIKDGPWQGGFLKIAARADAPIVPIRIAAKNSSLFYAVSTVYKPLSALLLPSELFRHRGKTIRCYVGAPIPKSSYQLNAISYERKVKLMKKHLFRVGRKGPLIFTTETSIAHPENRQSLKQALKQAQLLGQTSDGKQIYLYDYERNSPVLREIGRLRELTFRKVGEGTGTRRDTDQHDREYRHLVLWDDEHLEIVGSYRIGETRSLLATGDRSHLYTHSLFELLPAFAPYLQDSIELGRSFVQPRFWGSRALDYLWQGIGAYLRTHPQVRTLFGPASISGTYPQAAKEMLVWYYGHYHGSAEPLARARSPFILTQKARSELAEVFSGQDAQADLQSLKTHLRLMGVAIPTLYKQYTDVFEPGGLVYCDFGVDAAFKDCVDGLIVAQVAAIKPSKRQRYIGA